MAKVRTTITIDAELLARWQAIADRERRSLSACLNGWLEQVTEPAEYVASVLDDDREASKERLRQVIQAMEVGTQVVREAAQRSWSEGKGGRDAGRHAAASLPPSCNTGGKSPRPRGKKA